MSANSFDLLRAWRAGDREAGQALVRAFQPKLARLIYPKLGPEEGREVIQETLLSLCEHVDRYRGEGSFDAFVFGVARYKILEYKRSKAVHAVRESKLDHDQLIASPEAEEHMAAKFANNVIVQALRGLPRDDQMLLELHDHAGLKRRELAAILAIPEGTVASRVDRARRRLRRGAEALQASPAELESTNTSLASYWAELHEQWTRGPS